MADLINQQYELVDVDRLSPHPRNPRQGDVGAIASSIDANGFYGAVIVQRSTGTILAGKHRWDAARAEGLAQVPVLWVDVDDERATRIVLADNRTADLAAYDDVLLSELLAELAQSDAELAGTGWTGDDLDALLYDLSGPLGLSGGTAREGETPEDRRAGYEASAIRTLLLPIRADEYESLLADLAELRAARGYESNSDLVVALIREASA